MRGSCLKFDNQEELKTLLEEMKSGDTAKIFTSTGRMIEFKPVLDNDDQELAEFFSPVYSNVGLYLKPPHGHLIVTGRKTYVVKSVHLTENINKPIYLLSGDYACGVIELGPAKKVSLKEFKRLFPEHRISEPERLEWWPESTELYLHSVKMVRQWPVFRKWKRTDSYKVFVENVSFIDNEDSKKEDEPTRSEIVTKEIDRIGNWYMVSEDGKKHRYVVQHHSRGTSVHTDLRFEADGHLVGWTLDTPGSLTGKSKFLNPQPSARGFDYQILCQRKLMQPKVWLKVKGKMPAGGIGATKHKIAEFIIHSRGTVKFGTQKSDFHEYFLEPDGTSESDKKIKGRWIVAKIKRPQHFKKAGQGLTMWAAWKPQEQREYIAYHDFEKEKEKAIRDEIDMIWQGKDGQDKKEVTGIQSISKTAKHFF